VASGGKRYYVSLVFGGKPQGNSGDPFTKPKLKADQKPPAPAAPTAAAAPDPPVAPPGDGDVLWKDSGTPGAGALWMPSHSYSLGDSVASVGGELFVMVGAATGSTGDSRPVIPNQSGAPTTVTDNDVVWMHADNANCASQTGWQANHNYRLDDYVYGQNKQCYRAVRFTAGMSGPAPVCPFPPATSQGVQPDPNGVLDGNITWKAVPSDGGSSKAWQAGDPHTKGDVVYAGTTARTSGRPKTRGARARFPRSRLSG